MASPLHPNSVSPGVPGLHRHLQEVRSEHSRFASAADPESFVTEETSGPLVGQVRMKEYVGRTLLGWRPLLIGTRILLYRIP